MTIAEQYSPGDPKPLGGYAALTLAFGTGALAFAAAQRERDLPERIPPEDLVLLAAATHKLSRLITKDRVTSFLRAPFTRYEDEAGPSEVSEAPRGTGLQLAIGELLVCPYCIGQWVAAALVGTYVRSPRSARATASVFAALAGSDFLQQAWKAIDEAV